ncbi:MAG: hypothetical protein HW386_64 [Gammaproteobacteria bacterium]|nr:hypothetical protein [Gammaproteobacteria bacterium]
MNTKIHRLLFLLACLLASHNAPADGIEISSATSELAGEAYQLDASIKFNFDSEVRDALEHGVSINIDVIIRIKRERNWLWDPKVKEEVLNFKLEQHPLSNRYLVTELGSDSRKQFSTLEEALNYLGTIDDRLLISKTALAEDENYIGMIKAKVNTETLPAVIRPVASASKKWQLDSPWFKWSIVKE